MTPTAISHTIATVAAAPPLVPQIQVTLNCNLACSYCYEHHSGGVISVDTVTAILDKTVEHNRRVHGKHFPVQVYWHGGEPLLAGLSFYESVIKIQQGFSGAVFDNRIQTNGTLMTDEFARFFSEHDFSVGFSLDGPQNIHDANRRFKSDAGGSYQAARAGLERYLRLNPGKLPAIIAVISHETLGMVEEFYQFFHDIGARVQLDIYDLGIDDFQLYAKEESRAGGLPLRPEDIASFLSELFDLWFYSPDSRVDFAELRQEVKIALRPDRNLGDPFDKKRCDFRRIVFAPDGNAYSCDQYINNDATSLGNIADSSLDAIMSRKNALWQTIKEEFRSSGEKMACSSCDWGLQCSGGCLTCMKYNAAVQKALDKGLDPGNWREIVLPDHILKMEGETYYCQGLKRFRQHVRKAVNRSLENASSK